MIEISNASLIRINSTSTDSVDLKEILVNNDLYCPSIIGLKNPNDTSCCGYYRDCKDCWEKALAEVDDFKILWKYKGSDEYV